MEIVLNRFLSLWFKVNKPANGYEKGTLGEAGLSWPKLETKFFGPET